jgi:hypothetical protein
MAFFVPSNQSVSWSVYKNAVAAHFGNDFFNSHQPRVMRAFEMGEPIQMIVDELKFRQQFKSNKKTPLQLAVRVVKESI